MQTFSSPSATILGDTLTLTKAVNVFPERVAVVDRDVIEAKRLAKDIWQAASDGDFDVLRSRLSEGVDINVVGRPGKDAPASVHHKPFNNPNNSSFEATPLIFSAAYGHARIVQWLLRHGARADVRSSTRYTALDYAAHRGYVDVVRVLHGEELPEDVEPLPP
eukprot:TRINITY_DN56616_c0_g1_i1.p1 TRINITY_DN56616_c0_g1~~TRINITY_DN56616_c0_g1_i1.p1  ORF type:complete len:163 (-),score=8.64 TRINITY_DN56616_c0_g1_i1:94-582(-)